MRNCPCCGRFWMHTTACADQNVLASHPRLVQRWFAALLPDLRDRKVQRSSSDVLYINSEGEAVARKTEFTEYRRL